MNPENVKSESTNNGKSSKFLPAIIFGINLVVVLYLFFSNEESKNIISRQVKKHETDSLTIKVKEAEIAHLQVQFKKIIVENKSLGLTIGSMESSVKELDKLKRDIKLGRVPLSDLDKRISSIQKKFLKGRIEADSLLNKGSYLSFLRDSFNTVNKGKEDSLKLILAGYEDKLQKGNNLRAEHINVIVLNSKGREEKLRRNGYKIRDVKTFRVDFDIADNEIAKHCNRNLYLKIKNPEGLIMTDFEQGYKSKYGDYTREQIHYFNNTSQTLTFQYTTEEPLKPGKYTFALYNDNYKMGEEVVFLK